MPNQHMPADTAKANFSRLTISLRYYGPGQHQLHIPEDRCKVQFRENSDVIPSSQQAMLFFLCSSLACILSVPHPPTRQTLVSTNAYLSVFNRAVHSTHNNSRTSVITSEWEAPDTKVRYAGISPRLCTPHQATVAGGYSYRLPVVGRRYSVWGVQMYKKSSECIYSHHPWLAKIRSWSPAAQAPGGQGQSVDRPGTLPARGGTRPGTAGQPLT